MLACLSDGKASKQAPRRTSLSHIHIPLDIPWSSRLSRLGSLKDPSLLPVGCLRFHSLVGTAARRRLRRAPTAGRREPIGPWDISCLAEGRKKRGPARSRCAIIWMRKMTWGKKKDKVRSKQAPDRSESQTDNIHGLFASILRTDSNKTSGAANRRWWLQRVPRICRARSPIGQPSTRRLSYCR